MMKNDVSLFLKFCNRYRLFSQRSEHCPYFPDSEKREGPSLYCSSYRPNSLTCMDTKVYVKILDQVAGSLISYDQRGFPKGCCVLWIMSDVYSLARCRDSL